MPKLATKPTRTKPATVEEALLKIADALRGVAAKSQEAYENGHRSYAIDRGDLEETLLVLADEIDPSMD